MANIMKNRIDTVMHPGELQQIKDSIEFIISLLPKSDMHTLNEEEKEQLSTLDVDNKIFVEDIINEISNNGEGIMPVFITAEGILNDLTLFEQMNKLRGMIGELYMYADTILRIAANDAYSVSYAAYQFFKSAAGNGIPNAQNSYDKLKVRHEGISIP